MPEQDSRQIASHPDQARQEEPDTNLTSAADVASAGRSCLIILIMLGLIMVLLLAWVVYTTTGGTSQR